MIIYKATNLINGKCYIGQSINSLETRIKGHRKSISIKKNTTVFKKALKKYGIESFSWDILCEVNTKEELNDMEMFYIKHLDTLYPSGYNMSKGGDSPEITKEIKEKISKRTREAMQRPEVRERFLRGNELKNKPPSRKGKSHKEIYGEEKAIEISNKISNTVKEYFKEENNRIKTAVATKEAMQKPEIKEKISKRTREAMQRPEVRERLKNRFPDPGSASRDKKLMNNGLIQKRIPKDEIDFYLSNGWVLGKIKISSKTGKEDSINE